MFFLPNMASLMVSHLLWLYEERGTFHLVLHFDDWPMGVSRELLQSSQQFWDILQRKAVCCHSPDDMLLNSIEIVCRAAVFCCVTYP